MPTKKTWTLKISMRGTRDHWGSLGGTSLEPITNIKKLLKNNSKHIS